MDRRSRRSIQIMQRVHVAHLICMLATLLAMNALGRHELVDWGVVALMLIAVGLHICWVSTRYTPGSWGSTTDRWVLTTRLERWLLGVVIVGCMVTPALRPNDLLSWIVVAYAAVQIGFWAHDWRRHRMLMRSLDKQSPW